MNYSEHRDRPSQAAFHMGPCWAPVGPNWGPSGGAAWVRPKCVILDFSKYEDDLNVKSSPKHHQSSQEHPKLSWG